MKPGFKGKPGQPNPKRRTGTSEYRQEHLGGLTRANDLMGQKNYLSAAQIYQTLKLWESAAGAYESEAARLRKDGNSQKAEFYEDKAKILLGKIKS